MDDVPRSAPNIYIVVKNQNAYHQALVVELEGRIAKWPFSILIDPISNLIDIFPQVVEACIT
jgi:hypothetical protein